MPKQNEIIIPYDERKIDAMRKFPMNQTTSFEDDIMSAVNDVYKKRVPADVRFLFGDEITPPNSRARKTPPRDKKSTEDKE